MEELLSNHKDLPEQHHVARYCRPKHVQDGIITAVAFELRDNEEYLSTNWMEYFEGRESIRQQLECVREAMQNNYTLSPNGKFARLNVGAIKNSMYHLQIKHIPEPTNPSHAGIYYDTDKDENRKITLELADLVQAENTFPAL